MRIRKLALIGAIILVSVCFGLYLLLDRALNEERKKSGFAEPPAQEGDNVTKVKFTQEAPKRAHFDSLSTKCTAPVINPTVDIQMGRVYRDLKFDNIDGGVWKQGWNIRYSNSQWNQNNKLKVFIVPHSHNDPGWKKTFEEYYTSQTRSILNNMVNELTKDERRKFIWAEISFFALWWTEASNDSKEKVKELLKKRQLEIVTGGWVMSDEANSHYYSLIEQLVHGHQWLLENLEYRPRFSWSIDPFGLSPTLPFILRYSGFSGLAVQRSHYSIKKYLAMNKQLEFNWRQLWDSDGGNQLLTHMMPFYSYDVPHTCGPDPKICCQFDFKRLPGYGISCPWRVPPQIITENNVAQRADLLLDQYKKKAQLYATNVLLVPLGDDFRYDHYAEWDAQFINYQKLFDYINSNPSMNAQVQFGTLSDYFNALEEAKSSKYFPSLSGDFFTYADRDDHYWSGYFTSRPFYKRMDRVVISHMRAAEILFALATRKNKSPQLVMEAWPKLWGNLSEARASHSLFQHHDGITGTAKDYVVLDYANKMVEAVKKSQHVIQQSAHFLLARGQEPQTGDENYFTVDEDQKLESSLIKGIEGIILTFPDGISARQLTIFNSLTFKRIEVVHIKVENRLVQVKDMFGNIVKHQLSPICSAFHMLTACYQLSFVVEIEPLSLLTYTVEPADDDKNSHVNLKIFDQDYFKQYEDWDEKTLAPKEDFSIQNSNLSAAFNGQGFLKAITLKTEDNAVTVPVKLNFIKYAARGGKERSGAYLFLPDGSAKRVYFNNTRMILIEGTHFSRVIVYANELTHVVTLYNTHGTDGLGLEIQNLVNIAQINDNYEFAMRFETIIKNADGFYTDLNGIQMIRRTTYKKLPIQGNYYPMPNAAYIEDGLIRFTVLSAQPLGAAALHSGTLEIMQDRRLLQDDNRGLEQPIMDNKPTLTIFRIVLEQRSPGCKREDSPWGSLSAHGEVSSQIISYPLLKMAWTGDHRAPPPSSFSPKIPSLPPHHQLVMAHALRNLDTGIILRTGSLDHCFPSQFPTKGQFSISKFLRLTSKDKIHESTLTFNEIGPEVDQSIETPCENRLKAYFVPNIK